MNDNECIMTIIRLLLLWYPAPSISASKICPASRLSLASAQARFDKSCRGSPRNPWPCWARGKTRESLIFWDGDQLDQLGGPFLLRNSGAGYFGGNTYEKTIIKKKAQVSCRCFKSSPLIKCNLEIPHSNWSSMTNAQQSLWTSHHGAIRIQWVLRLFLYSPAPRAWCVMWRTCCKMSYLGVGDNEGEDYVSTCCKMCLCAEGVVSPTHLAFHILRVMPERKNCI